MKQLVVFKEAELLAMIGKKRKFRISSSPFSFHGMML